ncbi:hypothetical protein GIB67_017903 [Kingdonia uniflora]|uniref:Glycosyltransferases n=1 Tax=Kingdonia uniflora TaxID=39325 RepID=A0A7J7NDX2_9MAGN|nr:hypothetical protein GIB67_017903 [Kingdonia uniflora]
MASIRRAQSPVYHHHTRTPFSLPSSSHKFLHGSKYSSTSPQPHFIGSLQRFLNSIFIQISRKGNTSSSNHHSWKWPFFLFLVYFVLGFAIGFGQFGFIDDDSMKHGEFLFLSKIKPRYGGVRGEKIILETVKLGVRVGGLEDLKDDGFRGVRQLIIVTPHNRALQGYFLCRLSQVLRLAKPLVLWVVVEYNAALMEISEILRRSGVMYKHLVCKKNSMNVKDKGVHQRNTVLEHIGCHKLDGIMYFIDDDNIYSLELFESLREISGVVADEAVVSQESSGSVPIPQTEPIVFEAGVSVGLAPGVQLHQGTPLTPVIPGHPGVVPVPAASGVSAGMKQFMESFVERFFDQYFLQSYRDACISEFYTLEQGDMSVARYDQRFNELVHYAPFIVQDVEQKKIKILRGLRPFFRRFLISSGASTYKEVLSKVLALEQNEAEDCRSRDARNPVRQDTRPDKGKAVYTQYDSLGLKRQRFEGTPVWATGEQYLERAQLSSRTC